MKELSMNSLFFLAPRRILGILVALCIAVLDVLAAPFSDDFNRQNQPVAGLNWERVPTTTPEWELVIVSGVATHEAPDSASGIRRRVDTRGTVRFSADLFECSGFNGVPQRYVHYFSIHSSGALGTGYRLHVSRGDAHYNDSKIVLYDGDQFLEARASTFQFGTQIRADCSIAPDGSISGNITGDGQFFQFTFPAHEIQSSGPYFVYTSEAADARAAAPILARMDNLVITTGPPQPPQISIKAVVPVASEKGRRPGRFRIRRTGHLPAESVALQAGGTATAGGDYESLPASVTLAAGEAETDIEVKPLIDAVPRETETVIVSVVPPAGYSTRGTLRATVKIVEDFGTNYVHGLPKPGNAFPCRTLAVTSAALPWTSPDRWVRLKVQQPTELNVTVHGKLFVLKKVYGRRHYRLTADLAIELRDAAGNIVAAADHAGEMDEFLRRVPITQGEYFLRISNVDPSHRQATFAVSLSGGDAWDIVEDIDDTSLERAVPSVGSVGEAHHVGLCRLDGVLKPIEPMVGSWLAIHGRASDPETFAPLAVALVAQDAANLQPLVLGWETAAAADTLLDATQGRWFQKTGLRIAGRLSGLGLSGTKLNIAGHSWGTYVGYEIATQLGSGETVDRFLALDPALFANNYDNAPIHFDRISRYAWGIYTSALGNKALALTADDAFSATFDDELTSPDSPIIQNPILRHSAAHKVLLKIFGPRADALSRLLAQGILQRRANSWVRNPPSFNRIFTPKTGASASGNVTPLLQGSEGTIRLKGSTDTTPTKLYYRAPGGGGWTEF